MSTVRCYGCKARVPDIDGAVHKYLGAPAGCWALYTEVLAREYSDMRYMAVHNLTVDAYSVQHPGEPERRTIQSVAVHLMSLCLQLNQGYDAIQAAKIKSAATEISDQFVWLAPPEDMGAITIVDIHAVEDAEQHRALVKRWAQSAWDAWRKHHTTIRTWIDLI